MEPKVYQELARVEDSHWWFVGTRQTLLDRLLAGASRDGLVLDVGCGSGGLLRELARLGLGHAIGFDISPLALEHAVRFSPGRLIRADLGRLPFPDRTFALITCADVLEHVEDDRGALAEILRVLRPGGRLGLAVPAFESLWTEHDDANHHFRRYRMAPLCRLIREIGFVTESTTYVNLTLGTLMAAYRLVQSLARRLVPRPADHRPESDIKPMPAPLNSLCGAIYQLERRLVQRLDLPLGTSIVAVLSRP